MRHTAPPGADPCVWMAAGLVSYRLCDRAFDCERCPLDAALRGSGLTDPETSRGSDGGRPDLGFPDDRRYADGHTWVLPIDGPGDPVVRIGLDGLAARLLPRPVRVSCRRGPCAIERGDVICELELPDGTLPIRAPLDGRLERENAALRERPGLIVDAPYDEGWLMEFAPTSGAAAPEDLIDAAGARRRTELHLRRFRRQAALHLLADAESVGPSMADGGQALASLRDILGARHYLQILRDVLE